MRQLFVLFFCLFSIGAMAQDLEGVITYEQKINLHKKIDNEEMKAYIPEFQIAKMQLFFKGQQSVYKEVDDPSEEMEDMGGGMKITMKRSGGGEMHKDLENSTFLEDREFMGRRFLVEGELKKKAWKMGAASKEILGYTCNKATYQDSTGTTEVWFALPLAVSNGPSAYHGLPGMILEINKGDGEMIITATDIKMESVGESVFEKPKKGKKVTNDEFKAIVEERMKEMGGVKKGNGSSIMIIKQ